MTHDPLCPWNGLGDYWADVCGDCRLIARVREDERSAALRDALACFDQDDAHAAITALGGGR